MLECLLIRPASVFYGPDEPDWALTLTLYYSEGFEENALNKATCQVILGFQQFLCLQLFSKQQACSVSLFCFHFCFIYTQKKNAGNLSAESSSPPSQRVVTAAPSFKHVHISRSLSPSFFGNSSEDGHELNSSDHCRQSTPLARTLLGSAQVVWVAW